MADRRISKEATMPPAAPEIPDPTGADCMHHEHYPIREVPFDGGAMRGGTSVTPTSPRKAP